MKEADGWKIWHYFIGTDLQVEAGQLYGDQPVDLPDEENPVAVEFGKPTLPMEAYITRHNYYPYPRSPSPMRLIVLNWAADPRAIPNIRLKGRRFAMNKKNMTFSS